MLELLRQRVAHTPGLANKIEIVDVSFFVRLHAVHATCIDSLTHYYGRQRAWVKRIGGDLETAARQQVVGAVFVGNNR